jgi:hypothetical protein
MFWARVFGGGAGGLVARVRPNIDPPPLEARRQIEAWYAEQGVEWPDDGSTEDYESHGEGAPLIADDADVSVIAAHLTRMIIDLVARPDASAFPYSAYVVGMSDAWLFTAPFDTRPIDLGSGGSWETEPDGATKEALKQLIADLFPKKAEDAA